MRSHRLLPAGPLVAAVLFNSVLVALAQDAVPTSARAAAAPTPLTVNENGDRVVASDAAIAQFDAVAASDRVVTGPRITVRGYDVNPVEYPALPDVEGTRINSGKKTSFVKPEEFPTIVNNDYREALGTTPGLIVSEEPNSPIINIGYRGLDSQRSEFTQVLKDGVTIKNEQFGFPESHYTPVLDSIERIEFIRAGAALQFGPQPGGAINFVTKMPRRDTPFHFLTKNAFGTDELFTSFTSVDGTTGPLGYYLFYDHREREGFRPNSDYEVNAGSAKMVVDLGNERWFTLTLDAYDEEHGEPGGLRRREAVNPPGSVFYDDDRNVSTRRFDRFRLDRYYAVAEYYQRFSEADQLSIKAFGGYLSRGSKRQRGGGFGTVPIGAAAGTNSIQLREDWTQGAELRFRHDYALAGDVSTLTGGLYFYHAVQDRRDERGATPDAENGTLRNLNTGETWDGAIFAENRFHFGRLSITPGMRLEFLHQSLDEELNVSRPTLLARDDFSFVPLFGLGASYVLLEGVETAVETERPGAARAGKEVATAVTTVGPPRVELYGTVAQAYRPRTYGELVPTSATGVVNGDLDEGRSLQFELGVRGKPFPYLSFDVSGFYFTFEDQVGDITLPGGATSTANVGDARFAGIEGAVEVDLLAILNRGEPSPWGRLNAYGNVTLLDAEFTSGPNDGFTPSYAPDYQVKAGAIYRWKEIVKLGLIGTVVGDHFADSNNTFQRFIPSYEVWDLTAEVNILDERVGLFAGINNLFDRDFYAESRDEGILPAYRRNYYAGVKLQF